MSSIAGLLGQNQTSSAYEEKKSSVMDLLSQPSTESEPQAAATQETAAKNGSSQPDEPTRNTDVLSSQPPTSLPPSQPSSQSSAQETSQLQSNTIPQSVLSGLNLVSEGESTHPSFKLPSVSFPPPPPASIESRKTAEIPPASAPEILDTAKPVVETAHAPVSVPDTAVAATTATSPVIATLTATEPKLKSETEGDEKISPSTPTQSQNVAIGSQTTKSQGVDGSSSTSKDFAATPKSPKNGNSSPARQSTSGDSPLSKPKAEVSRSYIQTLSCNGRFSTDEIVEVLQAGVPENIKEYSEHLFKLANILYTSPSELNTVQLQSLERKLYHLMNSLAEFQDPIYIYSKLHVIVERNMDIFIKISTSNRNIDLATRTIRFLTSVFMNLNYWEIYNLLEWRPSIYRFLEVIHFDLNECYEKFLEEYGRYTEELRKKKEEESLAGQTKGKRGRKKKVRDPEHESDDHDKFISDAISGYGRQRKRAKIDSKSEGQRVVKKGGRGRPPASSLAASSNSSQAQASSNSGSADADGVKSSNYDPDVVHECQLPSADEPDKMCLRRFSRKYELIRHQETVHSKKKKLFKCFVCVKQNPSIGPRIFTRHDTLAKHIRVNHKISGKEAKAEVAYSKKHAEVVEDGDITVHVGRRKTKVDFELRAHMEKRKGSKDESVDSQDEYYDD